MASNKRLKKAWLKLSKLKCEQIKPGGAFDFDDEEDHPITIAKAEARDTFYEASDAGLDVCFLLLRWYNEWARERWCNNWGM